jgi:hypothetical protein
MRPVFGSQVLSGTASYTVGAASGPTDQNSVTGTLNSAILNVNFDRQSVDTALDITMPGSRHWTANASNVALGDGGGFRADTGGLSEPLAHRTLSVALNGDSTNNPQGHISGQLTGPLLNGAILSYTLGWGGFGVHEHVNGVVGFGSPSFSASADALIPYRMKLDSLGSVAGFDASTANIRSGFLSAAQADHEYLTRTNISAHSPNRLKGDSQGALVEFDTLASFVSGGAVSCSPATPCGVNDVASRVSIVASGSPASGPLPAMPAIPGAPATVAEFGRDAATGISWGRYASGNFAVVDRVTGNPIGSGTFNPGPVNHYLLGPVQSGPTTLPTTGTAVYTFAGGTRPTDSFGATGTLNTATLSANFSAKTVDAGVNLSVGGRTWSASVTGAPIIAGVGFEGNRTPGGAGSLAVSCTGCASTTLSGRIIGGFTGTSGQGAGMAYTLNAGGVPQTLGGSAGAVTVGGVAAFRR